jgi:hypothetical protein
MVRHCLRTHLRTLLTQQGTHADKDSNEPSVISIIDELVANGRESGQITSYSSGVGTGHSTRSYYFGGKVRISKRHNSGLIICTGVTGRGLHAKVRKAFGKPTTRIPFAFSKCSCIARFPGPELP